MNDHDFFMGEALRLARDAYSEGEVPVGCVIVRDGTIIGRGRNRREKSQVSLAHAEVEAIYEACRAVGSWRLDRCTMYVTLEPCPMCAGAVYNARIQELYFGAKDEQTGSCGSVINLFMENYGFSPKIVGGILAEECGEILSDFFKNLRK